MTARELCQRTLRFECPGLAPFLCGGAWSTTMARWNNEGMPAEVTDAATLGDYFGCHAHIWGTGMDTWLCPGFEEEVIEQTDRHVTYRDKYGVVKRELRSDAHTSMPQFIEHPVRTREDFQRLRPHLHLNPDDRLGPDWDQRCADYNHRDIPLFFPANRGGSFFGSLRDLMGLEGLLFALYDDPTFVEEMMDVCLEFALELADRVLDDLEVEGYVLWEDMGYRNGPLISPEMFSRFMVPRYRQLTDFIRSKGVDVILVDSDGDVRSLIPLWMEGGVNGIVPCEVQANMDVAALRREYGRDLLLVGGVDKRAPARSREAVDDLLARVAWTVEQGGYIPLFDHGFPHDIPWDNFCYLMEGLREATGAGQ